MSGVTVPADQLAEQVRAAESAAPSPWYFDGRDLFCTRPGAEAHHLLIPMPETWHESQRVPSAVIEFIAACDPATVDALLAALEAAEQRVKEQALEYLTQMGQQLERANDAVARAERAEQERDQEADWRAHYQIGEAVQRERVEAAEARAVSFEKALLEAEHIAGCIEALLAGVDDDETLEGAQADAAVWMKRLRDNRAALAASVPGDEQEGTE